MLLPRSQYAQENRLGKVVSLFSIANQLRLEETQPPLVPIHPFLERGCAVSLNRHHPANIGIGFHGIGGIPHF